MIMRTVKEGVGQQPIPVPGWLIDWFALTKNAELLKYQMTFSSDVLKKICIASQLQVILERIWLDKH